MLRNSAAADESCTARETAFAEILAVASPAGRQIQTDTDRSLLSFFARSAFVDLYQVAAIPIREPFGWIANFRARGIRDAILEILDRVSKSLALLEPAANSLAPHPAIFGHLF